MFKINRLIARGLLLSKPGSDYSLWLYDLKGYFESKHMDAGVILVDNAVQAGDDAVQFAQNLDQLVGYLQHWCNRNGNTYISADALRRVLLVNDGNAELTSEMAEYLGRMGLKTITVDAGCGDCLLMQQIVSHIDAVSIAIVVHPCDLNHGSWLDFETGYLVGRLGDSVHIVCDNAASLHTMLPDMRCIDPHNWILGLLDALRRDCVVLVDPRK